MGHMMIIIELDNHFWNKHWLLEVVFINLFIVSVSIYFFVYCVSEGG